MDMTTNAATIVLKAEEVLANVDNLTRQLHAIKSMANHMLQKQTNGDSFLQYFTVFVLACFIGYYVVWNVSPALHSPLMAITNAISSVIIIGAFIPASSFGLASFGAVALTSINIFGGFIITHRMSCMFKRKRKQNIK